MSTLKEMIYNIRDTPSGGKSHRARGYSDRHIALMIRACRAFLIYADAKKKLQINSQFEQDMGCVKLTTVDQADCPQKLWGEEVKKLVLPVVLDLPGNAGVSFLGLIDKRTRIYLPEGNYGDLDDYTPFSKKSDKKAYAIGETIYLYGSGVKNLCVVNVRIIAYDPTTVKTCASETAEDCCFDEYSDNYPVPTHLEQALYDMVYERYISKGSIPEDVINDELKESFT